MLKYTSDGTELSTIELQCAQVKALMENVPTNWIQLWRGDKYSKIWAGQAMNREVQSIYIQQNENMNTHSVLKQTSKDMNEIVETRNNIWRIYYLI